jgi:hypothetical protein
MGNKMRAGALSLPRLDLDNLKDLDPPKGLENERELELLPVDSIDDASLLSPRLSKPSTTRGVAPKMEPSFRADRLV